MTLLSLVVPVRESEGDLENLLHSLLPLSFDKRWELIVVDDASMTPLAATIARATEKGLPVKYRRLSQRSGPGAARNAGVELANGHFVSFIDVDDEVILPSLLEVAQAAESLGLHAIAGGYVLAKESTPGQHTSSVAAEPAFTPVPWQDRLNDPPAIWSWVFQRQFLVATGLEFPALSYAEDLIFLLRVSREAKTFLQTDVVTYVHRINGGGSPGTSASSVASARDEFPKALRALRVEWQICPSWQKYAIVHWRLRIASRFLFTREFAGTRARTIAASALVRTAVSHPILAGQALSRAWHRKKSDTFGSVGKDRRTHA